MTEENKNRSKEDQARIELDIAGWMRLGYKREHLLVMPDGQVLVDTEAVDLDGLQAVLEGCEKKEI